MVSQSSDVFSVHSNHMFYLVCLVFQGLVYAFRIHQDIAEKWFYFWSQCWIECSNGSEGFVRTTITFPCLWNCSHTFLAKYVRAIGNVEFDISFSCIREQHIATITMNPKRVHFRPGPGFSNSLLGILRNCWVSSDVVSDVYSFAKKGLKWLSMKRKRLFPGRWRN